MGLAEAVLFLIVADHDKVRIDREPCFFEGATVAPVPIVCGYRLRVGHDQSDAGVTL